MGPTCLVAPQRLRRTNHDLQLHLEVSQRIITRRNELEMSQEGLAAALGVSARTYVKFEGGYSRQLTFGPDGQGQDTISRIEHGDLGWSGNGATRLYVGPGMTLLNHIEEVLQMEPGDTTRGIYYPDQQVTSDGTLADRISKDSSISVGKKAALLEILNGPDAISENKLMAIKTMLNSPL